MVLGAAMSGVFGDAYEPGGSLAGDRFFFLGGAAMVSCRVISARRSICLLLKTRMGPLIVLGFPIVRRALQAAICLLVVARYVPKPGGCDGRYGRFRS